MAAKKNNKEQGGHRNKAKLVRLHDRMWEQLAKLVERNGSDATEEIRIAVRERLERADLWPPSPPGSN